jgi:TetR/AcrR family transcriptional repressor of lmrAB and yxaGH operons
MDAADSTKKRMVRTMRDLLQRQGYYATGINEVLAVSKAPKGVLYHHFPGGKAELAASAVRQAGESILAGLAHFKRQSADPIQAITLFIDFYLKQLAETNYAYGCPVATVTLETAGSIDPLQAELKGVFEAMVAFVASGLSEHGIGAAAAHTQATLVIAMLEGALMLSLARRDPEPLTIVRDHLEAYLRPLLSAAEQD